MNNNSECGNKCFILCLCVLCNKLIVYDVISEVGEKIKALYVL